MGKGRTVQLLCPAEVWTSLLFSVLTVHWNHLSRDSNGKAASLSLVWVGLRCLFCPIIAQNENPPFPLDRSSSEEYGIPKNHKWAEKVQKLISVEFCCT